MSFNASSGSDPELPPPLFPADLETRSGDSVPSRISWDAMQIYRRTFGCEPTRVRTYVEQQYAVCLVKGVFDPAELARIATGCEDEVSMTRRMLTTTVGDQLVEVVEDRTGRSVGSHNARLNVEENFATHVFVFD